MALGSRRSVLYGMLVLTLIAPLTGCATETTCVSWVSYDSVQDAYDDAELVVLGTARPSAGQTTVFGEAVPLRLIDVERVLKGDAPDVLEVASTPLTCSTESVADPLAGDERVVIMLTNDGGTWRTLTPYAGVLAAPEGEQLPIDVD